MIRITSKDVESNIRRFNREIGTPESAWSDGHANIGNYHLYSANGMYSLHVIMNEDGGVHNMYTGTLREINLYVHGMRQGFALANKA